MFKTFDYQCPFNDKTPLGKKSAFWYNVLFDKAMSLFKYTAPTSVNTKYLEAVLLTSGFIIGLRDNDNNVRLLRGSAFGIDPYNFPTDGIVANPVLGNLKCKFGVDGVLGFCNKSLTSAIPFISEKAQELAMLDLNIDMTIDNYKNSLIFFTDDIATASKIKQYQRDIHDGKPAVIVGNDIASLFARDGKSSIPVIANNIDYKVPEMLKDRRTIISDFYSYFGVKNCSIEKNERLNVDEVNANSQETYQMREFWLAPRREMCDEINRILKPDVKMTVEMVEEIEYNDEVNENVITE